MPLATPCAPAAPPCLLRVLEEMPRMERGLLCTPIKGSAPLFAPGVFPGGSKPQTPKLTRPPRLPRGAEGGLSPPTPIPTRDLRPVAPCKQLPQPWGSAPTWRCQGCPHPIVLGEHMGQGCAPVGPGGRRAPRSLSTGGPPGWAQGPVATWGPQQTHGGGQEVGQMATLQGSSAKPLWLLTSPPYKQLGAAP